MEQDVGDVAQGYPLSQLDMGVDIGCHFEHFTGQKHAQAVFGVPAIDLISDPPLGIDVAAAALQEEGFTAEHLLDDLAALLRGNQMSQDGSADQQKPGGSRS